MLRKTLIALGAVAVLGGAALAPTSASAGWGHGWGHHHGGIGIGFGFAPTYTVMSNCYWVKKYTPFGVRFVKVCEY